MSEVVHLGRKSEIPKQPGEAIIDCVPAPYEGVCVRFTCPEFTSICPVTGQPDFATIVIDYVPKDKLIESKALKLYLFAFRNHGAFHEQCVADIGARLFAECEARWMRVAGYFMPRGGIPIDVFWQDGELPADVWVPEQTIPMYRGR